MDFDRFRKKKGVFLERTAQQLGLGNVRVYAQGVQTLAHVKIKTLMVRAVGPLGRIYGLVKENPSWVQLIVFKTQGWEQDWELFNQTYPAQLCLGAQHVYRLPGYEKSFHLVRLVRVSK
jgi:16S rRNA G527 N7-methylase RsmG